MADIEEPKTSSIPVLLSTIDNPHDPFSAFAEWRAFDESRGYNTMAYLARIVQSKGELSDELEIEATRNAIEEILSYNITGLYIKVEKGNFIVRIQSDT